MNQNAESAPISYTPVVTAASAATALYLLSKIGEFVVVPLMRGSIRRACPCGAACRRRLAGGAVVDGDEGGRCQCALPRLKKVRGKGAATSFAASGFIATEV
jgi:hypothetical protein